MTTASSWLASPDPLFLFLRSHFLSPNLPSLLTTDLRWLEARFSTLARRRFDDLLGLTSFEQAGA